MNQFFDNIFKHSYYKAVINAYSKISGNYSVAYEIWLRQRSLTHSQKYEFKQYIYDHFNEIDEIQAVLNKGKRILKKFPKAIEWLFYADNKKYPSVFHYEDYKYLVDNYNIIKGYDRNIEIYKDILRNNKKAVSRFAKDNQYSNEFLTINAVIHSIDKIKKINTILNNANSIKLEFHYLLWDHLFAKGRSIDDIPLEELAKLQRSDFLRASDFISAYSKKRNQSKLIIGSDILPTEAITSETKQQIEYALQVNAMPLLEIKDIYADTYVSESELQRAILNSVTYSKSSKIKIESSTILIFYRLRKKLDAINKTFDEIDLYIRDNFNLLKEYSYNNGETKAITKTTFEKIINDDKSLQDFIKTKKKEKDQRDLARNIEIEYRLGFSAIFGNSVNFDTCDISKIINIIDRREEIRACDAKEKRKEAEQKELEQKMREQKRIKNEIEFLRNCTASWPRPRNVNLPCFSLYYYYPTTCDWSAGDEEWWVRKLIWNFKASPNTPQSEETIVKLHNSAEVIVIPYIKKVLLHFLGSELNKLTLVCIPSSKKIVTERRYKTFSENLCKETGMINGYPFVKLITEGDSAHLGGINNSEYALEQSFFRGKFVLIFDDVITSGRSMNKIKIQLESCGAFVIGGISLGFTKHEYQGDNPINQYL